MDEYLRKLQARAIRSGTSADWELYRLIALRAGICIICENEGKLCSRCGPLSLCHCQCYCCGSELEDCSACPIAES